MSKRFSEFVGKRANANPTSDKRFEFIGKREPYGLGDTRHSFRGDGETQQLLGSVSGIPAGYDVEGKRYEFGGKRRGGRPDDDAAVDDKRAQQYEFVGKRMHGKRLRLPYEFVGKRIFGSAWERVSADAIEGDALLKDVTDIVTAINAKRAATRAGVGPMRNKRYSEWLGKRGGAAAGTASGNPLSADQLLRDLMNKRISAILQSSSNPEFIGRRQESRYVPGLLSGLPARGVPGKRYTEFIGK